MEFAEDGPVVSFVSIEEITAQTQKVNFGFDFSDLLDLLLEFVSALVNSGVGFVESLE